LDRVAGLQIEIAAKLQAGYLVCRLRLLQNFRQGMWSADSDCYKTSGRVHLQTELGCCKTSGRVSGLQTENATKLWTGKLVCRLRLLQHFREGIWSAD